METNEIIQLVTAISTALIAVSGVFAAIFWGYIPRQKEKVIKQLQKELFDCYCDIYNLLEIEKAYMADEMLSKKAVRKDRKLTSRSEPAKVNSRLNELRTLVNK